MWVLKYSHFVRRSECLTCIIFDHVIVDRRHARLDDADQISLFLLCHHFGGVHFLLRWRISQRQGQNNTVMNITLMRI